MVNLFVDHTIEKVEPLGGFHYTELQTTISSDEPIGKYFVEGKENEWMHREDSLTLHTAIDRMSFDQGNIRKSAIESYASLAHRGMLVSSDQKSEEPIEVHLMNLAHFVSKVPSAKISVNTSYAQRPRIDFIRNEQGITLETKLEFPKSTFPDGFTINDEKIYAGSLQTKLNAADEQTVLRDHNGKSLFTFKHYDEKHPLIGHNKAIGNIAKSLIGAYEDDARVERHYYDKHEKRHLIARITSPEFWQNRLSEMNSIALDVAQMIKSSPLAGYVQDIILYGSLARREDADDIDLMLIVNDQSKKVLDPSTHLQGSSGRYHAAHTTDGLFKELGIDGKLKEYAAKTNSYEARNLSMNYTSPSGLSLGRYGIKVDLNAVFVQDCQSEQVMEELMKGRLHGKINETYFKDVLNEGLIVDPSTRSLSPARQKYEPQIVMLSGILERMPKAQW